MNRITGDFPMNRFLTATMLILAIAVNLNCSEQKPVPDQALAAYWKFDELTQNNRMTPDTSGNGHDGLVHGQSLVKGINGSAMQFEGYDQIVEVGDLGLKAPTTLSFWVKTNDVFHDRRLFSQMEGSENQSGALRFDGTQVEVWDGSTWQVLIDHNVRINTWIHVAVVYDENGKTYGFLNGERQHLVRSGFDFTGVRAAIGGKFQGTTGNEYIGLMDDFRVYGKTLNENEIKSLYSLQ